MEKHHFKVLVPGIFAATALALTVGVGAQTAPPSVTPAATKCPEAGAMAGHHKGSAAAVKHEADLKAECQAMTAKKQEMQEKLKAMDDTLDKLVAEMNAAKESKQPDALEKPMAAVITELVAQRKVMRSMMMKMSCAMMEQRQHQMHVHRMKGTMKRPMMKMGNPPEPKAEETKPEK